MKVAVVAHVTVKDGMAQEFEAVVYRHRTLVHEHEPGAEVYELFRSRTQPNHYTFLEIYRDAAAYQAHAVNSYLDPGRRLLYAMHDGAPDIQLFDGM